MDEEINTSSNVAQDIKDIKRIVANINTQLDGLNYLPPCGEELLQTSKKKILVIGYYGDKNYGDELMLQVLWNELRTRQDVAVSIILVHTWNYNLKQWEGANLVGPPITNDHVTNAANYYDEVIVGGGAHLDDRPSNRLDHIPYLAIELSLACIGKSKQVAWVGVSSNTELSNATYITKLQTIINDASHFSLRDPYSLKALQTAGIDTTKVVMTDDIALATNMAVKTIGVTLLSNQQNEQEIIDILNDIRDYARKRSQQYQIALLPFFNGHHTDRVFYERLMDKVDWQGVPVFIAPEYENTDSMLLIIKACDVLINMRYHASLLGLLSHTPTISLCYDVHPHYYNKVTHIHNKYNDKNIIYLSDYSRDTLYSMLARFPDIKDMNVASDADNMVRHYLRSVLS